MIRFSGFIERYDLAGKFVISKGTVTAMNVMVVEVVRDGNVGRGECVPMGSQMLNENQDNDASREMLNIFHDLRERLEHNPSRAALYDILPKGALRNAIDCALWDLEAKETGRSIWQLAGVGRPDHLVTAYTLSLASPEAMAQQARQHRDKKLLKLKLGGDCDVERVAAVAEASPHAVIIVDANEAWTLDELDYYVPQFARYGVKLIEQPLAAGKDQELISYRSSIPLCADESCHDSNDLDYVVDRYQIINIKLDKTGGLTEALKLAKGGQERGLGLMVGCMAGTSLSMAPGMVVGAMCEFVDLDGPLLFSRDRADGIAYQGSIMQTPSPRLWG